MEIDVYFKGCYFLQLGRFKASKIRIFEADFDPFGALTPFQFTQPIPICSRYLANVQHFEYCMQLSRRLSRKTLRHGRKCPQRVSHARAAETAVARGVQRPRGTTLAPATVRWCVCRSAGSCLTPRSEPSVARPEVKGTSATVRQ